MSTFGRDEPPLHVDGPSVRPPNSPQRTERASILDKLLNPEKIGKSIRWIVILSKKPEAQIGSLALVIAVCVFGYIYLYVYRPYQIRQKQDATIAAQAQKSEQHAVLEPKTDLRIPSVNADLQRRVQVELSKNNAAAAEASDKVEALQSQTEKVGADLATLVSQREQIEAQTKKLDEGAVALKAMDVNLQPIMEVQASLLVTLRTATQDVNRLADAARTPFTVVANSEPKAAPAKPTPASTPTPKVASPVIVAAATKPPAPTPKPEPEPKIVQRRTSPPPTIPANVAEKPVTDPILLALYNKVASK